jgi:predicted O-methyltransferase YrrM
MKKPRFPDKTRINESAYRLSCVYHRLAVAEVDELKRVVRTLGPDPVAVVLGAGPGTATMTLLESRSDTTVTSIDLRAAWIEKKHAAWKGCLDRLTQIQACSWEAAEGWTQPIDFLFVDASHTYESVKKDIAAWLPFVKDGGIVWFHDYGTEHGIWQYVKRAVDEEMKFQEQIARVCCSIAFKVKKGSQ